MASYALMVEYVIEEKERDRYAALMDSLSAEAGNPVELYEGTDQANLFVEIWPAESEADVRTRQEERLSERSPWHAVGGMVAGGPARIHAWTFKPAFSR